VQNFLRVNPVYAVLLQDQPEKCSGFPAVGGSVIHRNQLEIGESLVQKAANRLADVAGTIVNRHHDA
jgi:hypothetical protein